MKETIERLKTLADRAGKYNYPEGSNMGVRILDIRAVLEFYKSTIKESGLTEDEFNNGGYTDSELNCKGCMGPCGQCKEEPPNAPDITPEWDKIPEPFNTVGIEPCGTEYAFRYIQGARPLINWINEPPDKVKTGRKFDMSEIDWTKTLSKRPVK